METPREVDLRPLTGSWRLRSEIVTFSDTGERVEPHGASPDGWMMLNETGRIMFLFGDENRRPPQSDGDKVRLFNTMVGYTGKVRIDAAGRFVTTVDLAVNPAIRGEQIRYFTLSGNQLTIQTPEQTIPIFGDRLLVIDLVWIRDV